MPTDLTSLVAPERNRYFYGLLMDAERFQRDQDYFNRKRLLMNRFVTGAGVVCGLGLTFDAKAGALTLDPGIALDLAGREIIVPAPTPVNLTQLTDATGKPTGPVPSGSTILISLAYAEQKVDAVPVLVPDCDYPNGCAPSAIEESFRIVITLAAGGTPVIPGCVFGALTIAPGAAMREAIAKQIASDYGPAPAQTAIALGRLTLPDGPLDAVSDRPLVYNNVLLYQLIACLAAQPAKIAALIYVSGDNQDAPAGTALPNPLVVTILDAAGNPVSGGAAPQFTVPSGGGSLSAVTSTGPGVYQASWTLGSTGAQVVTAQSTQSNLIVTFHATIRP